MKQLLNIMEFPFLSQSKDTIIPLIKESRHGKHKPGYVRPEFRTPEGIKLWNERSKLAMAKMRDKKKSLRPKLTLKADLEKKGWAYIRSWSCLDKSHVRLSYNKGNKACYLSKWNERLETRTISQILIEDNKNAVLILHNKKHDKPAYLDANIGEVDIDCSKYTGLFANTAYNSRKIGSVKFLFLFKDRDMKTVYWQKNLEQGIKCKFDFKVSGHSYIVGSTHQEGDLYSLKRYSQPFFINKNYVFSSASEVYRFVIHTIKKFEQMKELKNNKDNYIQAQIVQQWKYEYKN